MQKITDELIEKFLRGDCTKEEAAMVVSYLRGNPEEQYLQKEYAQTDGETPLPEGYREEMLAYITERTIEETQAEPVAAETTKRVRVLPLWRWAASAAAAVILIWQGWSYLQTKEQVTKKALAQYQSPEEAAWIEKYNQG